MKISTVPKGYRLKPATHKLIEKLQYKLKCSKDKIISEAVELYFKETIKLKKQK